MERAEKRIENVRKDRIRRQGWTGQDSTVQYSTVQYSTVQYSTVQYSTVHYRTGHSWLVERTWLVDPAPPLICELIWSKRLCSFALASHSARSSCLLAWRAVRASEMSNISPMSELYMTSNWSRYDKSEEKREERGAKKGEEE